MGKSFGTLNRHVPEGMFALIVPITKTIERGSAGTRHLGAFIEAVHTTSLPITSLNNIANTPSGGKSHTGRKSSIGEDVQLYLHAYVLNSAELGVCITAT